jgi:putative endonuclease
MPPLWTVYMLACADGSLYTGITNDLEKRLRTHQSGRGAAYTRARLPVRIVFTEAAEDRSAALRREAALKKLSRAHKLKLVPLGKRRHARVPRGRSQGVASSKA